MITGARSKPGQLGLARQSGSVIVDQKRAVCSGPSRTTNPQPWLKPAEGTRRAFASTRSSSSAGTARSAKLRHIFRRCTTAWKSIESDANRAGTLDSGVICLVDVQKLPNTAPNEHLHGNEHLFGASVALAPRSAARRHQLAQHFADGPAHKGVGDPA